MIMIQILLYIINQIEFQITKAFQSKSIEKIINIGDKNS